jgi:hypothetical protein
VAVLHFTGQPLRPDVQPYPDARQRNNPDTHYAPPDFVSSLSDQTASTTTWLIGVDSPLLTLAQDAMMNDLRVWFMGHLAAEGSGWEEQLALPLLLESITLVGS